MDFTVRPVTSARWHALEDLFGRSGASSGCWCMYWRIGPRYRDRPRADNKEDLRQLAASGRPPGLLAFDGNRAVGWCELAPRAELAWLARARYLGPVDDLPVWSVPCFYVRSSHRGRGVMDALIEAALPAAAMAGAPALEAYPVDTTVPAHTGNLFPGIAAAFARHGPGRQAGPVRGRCPSPRPAPRRAGSWSARRACGRSGAGGTRPSWATGTGRPRYHGLTLRAAPRRPRAVPVT